ncbi:MAG: ammonium transporter [Lactobacillaceae bacterium]|jgi:Amt family ammonium transporter|nr:ammonium transporter [Lactobacillaceae bacterium]
MNAADIAWVLIAAALVWLMVPGLALFYGGFTHPKSMVNTFAMVLIAIAVGSIIWFAVGYSLAFSGDGAILGNLNHAFLNGVSMVKSTSGGSIPDGAFALFQGMFPMITMAIIAGGVVGRMNFKAFLLFLIFWILLVYTPLAHMVWGGGLIAKMGALDFAGGDVVHISSGVSALVLALMIGKRRHMAELQAHRPTAIVIGGGLLWFGWFGFNAGSSLAANGQAILAFINTNLAAGTAMIAWMLIDMMLNKPIKVSGLMSGAVAGLVAITPAAGYVAPGGAAAMGAIVSVIVYFGTTFVKEKLGYDDTLDAFGIHGIGGVFGGLLTGVFATKAYSGTAGVLEGNWSLLGIQAVGILITIAVVVVATYVIAKVVSFIVPLRADENEEAMGLDAFYHGETI